MNRIAPEVVGAATTPMMTHGQAVATATNGRSVGCCCITGCIFSSMELIHRCHNCERFVHMICAEPFNNSSEDERYCNRCAPKK